MAPKRPAAAAASGSASDSEADAARHHHPRSASPSPSRSRSRSKTPPPNLHPNAAALSSTPASAAADFAAASDSNPGADFAAASDSNPGADFAAASDSNAGADGRLPSPRRSRERSPRIHSDSENSAAAAAASDDDGGDEGNASPPPRARRSSLVEAANIKPISSRPMDGPRRPAAGSSASQRRSKRPRSSAVHSTEQQRRPPRVWSPEDEVTILRALISYRAKKGVLPASTQDTGKFHSQIRGQLNVKASATQLSDKVRRLRHKYNLLVTRTKNGRDPDLPTAHDRDVYELSKKVWGSKGGGAGSGGGGGGGRVYENAEVAESVEEQESGEIDGDMEDGWDEPDHSRNRRLKAIAIANGNGNASAVGGRTGHSNSGGKGDVEKGKDMYPYLWEAVEELSKEHPSGTAFRTAFGVLEGSRARVMEEKLQKFRLSEIRQQLRRMDLMKETVKMVLDALEGTD